MGIKNYILDSCNVYLNTTGECEIFIYIIPDRTYVLLFLSLFIKITKYKNLFQLIKINNKSNKWCLLKYNLLFKLWPESGWEYDDSLLHFCG